MCSEPHTSALLTVSETDSRMAVCDRDSTARTTGYFLTIRYYPQVTWLKTPCSFRTTPGSRHHAPERIRSHSGTLRTLRREFRRTAIGPTAR